MSANLDRLEKLAEAVVARHQAPGLAIAARRGEERIEAAAGVSSTQAGQTLSLDDRLPMSCLMKPLVALTCLHLAERGELDLDADLAVLLPELSPDGAPSGVTPRHLLAHTAGYVEPEEPNARWAYDWARFVAFFPRRRQAFAPGSVWSYTHTGYAVLARLAEQAAGRPIRDLLGELLLDPLGIRLGEPGARAGEDNRLMALHVRSPRSGRFEPMRPPREAGFLRFSISDYTISTRDLLALGRFLASGSPGIDAGIEAARLRMLAPVVEIAVQAGRDEVEHMPTAFGLGLGSYSGLHGVNGSYVGSTCALRFDAATGATAAVTLNAWLPQARDLAMRKLEGFLRPRSADRAPSPVPRLDDLAPFEGVYKGLMLGSASLEIRRDGLAFQCVVARLGAPDLQARLCVGAEGEVVVDEASPGFAISLETTPQGAPVARVGASAYARIPAA
ncbi:serine hydrolase domain-containing protein [Caulobacter endophyticus]|uniref:serine hydrolase domain-containing protein n=1 Tax=Caulobacter endophyticus TaxID=2172652 RepID=UPI00240E9E7A|nr:serine hydrolase domain-containing protein [Caulobacter endophyticus]MDG2528906.1 serine hydrolase [Caulobacter endophyticus]